MQNGAKTPSVCNRNTNISSSADTPISSRTLVKCLQKTRYSKKLNNGSRVNYLQFVLTLKLIVSDHKFIFRRAALKSRGRRGGGVGGSLFAVPSLVQPTRDREQLMDTALLLSRDRIAIVAIVPRQITIKRPVIASVRTSLARPRETVTGHFCASGRVFSRRRNKSDVPPREQKPAAAVAGVIRS